MKDRVYICHTYYHAYIACLKELQKRRQGKGQGGAALVLSSMSTDFENLQERVQNSGLFDEVMMYPEKDWTYFPELAPYKQNTGSLLHNLINRIRFCRKLGELEEEYVPTDFAQYKDIYVFCDSDPVGYYLAYKKIRYHAVEDGLNCIRYRDTAREDNRGHFGLKAFLSSLGLIFIQNGYSRYCIDMEVNDLSILHQPNRKMIEVPRRTLTQGLTRQEKDLLTGIFIAQKKELDDTLQAAARKKLPIVLILTEPLCQDRNMRRKLFTDMISQYGTVNGQKAQIVIKPHPRDDLDYTKIFPQYLVLRGKFPMEILNFTGAVFDRVVTVYTVLDDIRTAREKVFLGDDFMDLYEDPALHREPIPADAKTVHVSDEEIQAYLQGKN